MLPGYLINASVCVPEKIGALAVWRQNTKKIQKNHGGGRFQTKVLKTIKHEYIYIYIYIYICTYVFMYIYVYIYIFIYICIFVYITEVTVMTSVLASPVSPRLNLCVHIRICCECT